jgi:excisionase family DNA binding protein
MSETETETELPLPQQQAFEAKRRRRPSLHPPLPRKTGTVQECADITGLGLTMITGLIRDGTLRSVKVGRRRLIFLDSIDELLGCTEPEVT